MDQSWNGAFLFGRNSSLFGFRIFQALSNHCSQPFLCTFTKSDRTRIDAAFTSLVQCLARKLGLSNFAVWVFFLPHRRFSNGQSIKEAINMKPKQIFNSILAVLFVFPLMGTFAQQAPNSGSIEVITTFDYPGPGNSTLPQNINERGDIVGIYIDSNQVNRGFVRFSDGSFSAPIVEPKTLGFTQARSINSSGTICGDYFGSDFNIHGFFLTNGTFTEYDVAGASNTFVQGINDPADFAGIFGDSFLGPFQAFVSVDGTITSFSVPGATSTLAYQLNNSNQLLVGYYDIDGSGIILHGYYRDANGALTFPIDPPGSTTTVLFGVNDRNFVVGRYTDSSGVTHGLFF